MKIFNQPWLCLLLLLLGLVFGLLFSGFDGLYGQDAYEYYRCSCELWNENAPDCHFPPMYPLYSWIFSVIFGNTSALQMVSLFAFIGVMWFLNEIIRLIYGQKQIIILYVLLFGGMSAYFFRGAILGMSDMLTTFFMIGGLYGLLRVYVNRLSLKTYGGLLVFSVFFLTQAVFTRYASIPLVLYYLGIGAFLVFRKISLQKAAILIVSALVIVGGIAWVQKGFVTGGLTHIHVKGWHLSHFFESVFHTPDGNLRFRFNNFFFGLFTQIHPGFGLLGVLFVVLLRRDSFTKVLLFLVWIPLGIYVVFLMGIPFQNIRFYILSFPLCVIIFFPPFMRLFGFLEKYQLESIFLTTVFFMQIILCVFALRSIIGLNRNETQMATFVQNRQFHLPIFTLGMEGKLYTTHYAAPVTSLFYKKITHYPDSFLLLVQPKVLETQWKSQNPNVNFQHIMRHYSADTVITFGEGWKLFKITRAKSSPI